VSGSDDAGSAGGLIFATGSTDGIAGYQFATRPVPGASFWRTRATGFLVHIPGSQ
jgi:hypothetical protein